MTAWQLLADLRARGVELEARGDRLRWRPIEALTKAERQALATHKADLLAMLTAVQASVSQAVGQTLGKSEPRPRNAALAWPAELTELIAWFEASTHQLPCEPFGLVPGWTDGWAVWVSDPIRFYSALAMDIRAGPRGPRAGTGVLAEDLRRLRALVTGR